MLVNFWGTGESFDATFAKSAKFRDVRRALEPVSRCNTGVLPDGPGAGVRTPCYGFAWASRWSARKISFATNGSAQPKASARNEVAAPRVAGSSGRTCVPNS